MTKSIDFYFDFVSPYSYIAHKRVREIQKKDLFKLAPFKANWLELPNRIHHTFSHFHLELMILKAEINHRNFVTSKRDGIWIKPNRFNAYPFPTLMKKIAQYVQKIN